MTIIAVKKERKKIILASDSQTTYHHSVRYRNKLFSVWNIHIGWAWLASESQTLKRYLIEQGYEEKTIKSESELFNLFWNFFKYLKDKWMIDSRASIDKEVFNSFIIVVENLWKAYMFASWYLIEIEDYDCIGSWYQFARAVLDTTGDIRKAIATAKKFDIYCWWDTNVLEIKI